MRGVSCNTDLASFVELVIKRQLPIKRDSYSIETSKRLRHYHPGKELAEWRRGWGSGDGRIKGFYRFPRPNTLEPSK